MRTPSLSLITVVRNDCHALSRTRASVLVQETEAHEWIVVDGASTDGTRDLVEEIARSGEATVLSEPDKGIYDAMNKGMALAEGKYLLFLNAGDVLASETALCSALKSLSSAGDPDIAFFSSWMDFGHSRILRKTRAPSYIRHGQPGLHQATFFKREMHLKNRFREQFKICGDYDVLARMKMAGAKIRSFPDVISINSFESSAASGRNKVLLLKEAAEIQRRVLKLSLLEVLLSCGLRSLNSVAYKGLTILRDLLGSGK